jgi:hypothetical protein
MTTAPTTPTLEERLREMAHDNWPLGDAPILGLLHDAAVIGDELGYARGRQEALEEAARVLEGRIDGDDPSDVPLSRDIDAIRAIAKRERRSAAQRSAGKP